MFRLGFTPCINICKTNLSQQVMILFVLYRLRQIRWKLSWTSLLCCCSRLYGAVRQTGIHSARGVVFSLASLSPVFRITSRPKQEGIPVIMCSVKAASSSVQRHKGTQMQLFGSWKQVKGIFCICLRTSVVFVSICMSDRSWPNKTTSISFSKYPQHLFAYKGHPSLLSKYLHFSYIR